MGSVEARWVLVHDGSWRGTVCPGGARYVSVGTVSPRGAQGVLEGNGRFWRGTVGPGAWWVLEGHCMSREHSVSWRGAMGPGGE